MPRKPAKKSPKDCIGGGFMCARPATKKVRGEWYCDIHLPKKSPAKRMKPKCSACGSTGIRKINSTGKWYCDLHFDPFPGTSSGSLIRGAKIVPTPTDSHTGDEGRTIEEIRKLAVRWRDKSTGLVLHAAGEDILRILNQKATTPTAKGGRK
jgi:hypothetical protein